MISQSKLKVVKYQGSIRSVFKVKKKANMTYEVKTTAYTCF